jgi:hypothetical protein
MSLTSFVSKLEDKRRSQGQRYKFSSLILTCILGNCCGYSGGREIARFARGHQKVLRDYLFYEDKIPSHVTFQYFLNSLDHEKLSLAFNTWVQEDCAINPSALDTVSGDGKALRSTVSDVNDKNQNFTQIVSLFLSKSGLTLCLQDFENEKKGEAEILRLLLQDLKKKGLL